MLSYNDTCAFCMYEPLNDKCYPCSRCIRNNPTENMFIPKSEYIVSDVENNTLETDPVLITPKKDDAVNHPAHYTDGSIEVIDFIEDKRLPYHLGNAVKYISRAGKKDPSKEIEDLKKAVWYINRYIELKEREGNE